MALKENQFYWEISLEHPELPGEEFYTRDLVIIDQKDYCRTVDRLRELITTYCVISEIDRNGNMQNEILTLIDELILTSGNIQYTEFLAYWKCLDVTYTVYDGLDKEARHAALKTLLHRYCKHRRELYDRFGYTHVIQQALYDSTTARSQGATGVQKVQHLLTQITQSELPIATSAEDFQDKPQSILLPDKSKDAFSNWIKQQNVQYSFGKTHQDKLPDILIKFGFDVFVLEVKHIKEPGGAQDKQITELIEYISQEEQVPIHYVAFMDGVYFNLFREPKEGTKPYRQRESIESALRNYEKNYFVNTEGLWWLLQDAYNKESPEGIVREESLNIYRTLFDRGD
ncbi:MAG: hypothetical protein KatS3mg019_0429 [Fimbriimonadales bacterium]|nr:MAG: hypothetical protein KatS3mg019_0429 [Fimbriimonadales bacterium]